MKDLELYIHIPFCVRKCKYCDFLSAPADRQVQNAYRKALLAEVAGRGTELLSTGEERRVTSVFIGGGTPSVWDPDWIGQLMEAVRGSFQLAPDAEITIETNPGTVGREGLSVYRSAGINRLSIGCQSADDEELEKLGRIHNYAQFLDTYHLARETGFHNINVDLMGALPGQTREANARNLHEICRLDPAPEHISAYSLIVEEGTPFFEMQRQGGLILPDEELERRMYWDTEEILRNAGYIHYEISNYARPGYECRHNCGYWRRTDYLGFGTGAASLFNNIRYSNARDLTAYIEDPLGSRVDRQDLSREDILAETMFLGLRMMEGVSAERFRQEFGAELEEIYGGVIEAGIRDGLLEYREGRLGGSGCPGTEERAGGDRRLSLTPRGIDLSNYVMAGFLL